MSVDEQTRRVIEKVDLQKGLFNSQTLTEVPTNEDNLKDYHEKVKRSLENYEQQINEGMKRITDLLAIGDDLKTAIRRCGSVMQTAVNENNVAGAQLVIQLRESLKYVNQLDGVGINE
jgi:hypothetical protein